MTATLDRERLTALRQKADAGATISLRKGKKSADTQYILVEDDHSHFAVLANRKTGEWVYGETIAAHEAARYS